MTAGVIFSHLAFALALFLLVPVRRLPVSARIGLLVGMGVLGAIPLQGLSLADHVRSLTDDLAITTLLWLGWCAAARIRGAAALPRRQQQQLALCFALLALSLYPASMGLSNFDPYRLGYSPRPLLLLVFATSLALWLCRHYFGAAMLSIATAFFALEIKSSDNYWDYLIDPLLGLFCWTLLALFVCRRLWGILRRPEKTVRMEPSSMVVEWSRRKTD